LGGGITAVVRVSGSGKSSLVFAPVAALRRSLARVKVRARRARLGPGYLTLGQRSRTLPVVSASVCDWPGSSSGRSGRDAVHPG
jgi:hypothetical protein